MSYPDPRRAELVEMQNKKHPWLFIFWLEIAIIAVIGVLGLLMTTRLGIGISPDSAVYIAGARNLLLGHGYSTQFDTVSYTPITHHAPFYSIILSGIGMTGIDPVDAARWVNPSIFAANVILMGVLLYSLLGIGSWLSVFIPAFGATLLLTSTPIFSIHSMAWTEGLFIFLGFFGIYSLSLYLDKSDPRLLFIASFLIGLSVFTRYAGVAFVFAGFIGVLLFSGQPYRKRFFDSMVFVGISLLPICLWMLRNLSQTGSTTNRDFILHPPGLSHIHMALTTISSWFLIPSNVSGYLKIIPLLAIITAFFFLLFFEHSKAEGKRRVTYLAISSMLPTLLKLIWLFLLSYTIFIIFSLSTLDANIPMDNRILSPAYFSLLIIAIYIISGLIRDAGANRLVSLGLIVLVVLLIVGYLPNWHGLILNGASQGIGFNSLVWRNSELIDEIRDLPVDKVIFSNRPEPIYIQTGRPAHRLPQKYESTTQMENKDYPLEIEQLQNWLKNDGVIVYFNHNQIDAFPSMDELLNDIQLTQIAETAEGVILGLSQP